MKIDGTFQHVLLGIISTVISILVHDSLWPAVWGLVTVELTQIEFFGLDYLKRKWFDTLHDLYCDFLGVLIGWMVIIAL
jgi:hypothetical protein